MAGFFDKVVVGINKGVNSVSEGSKNLMEKAKLNVSIQDIEKERDKVMQNLGSVAYNLQMSGAIDVEQFADMCGEITAMNQKIEDLKAQVAALESAKQQSTSYASVQQTAPNTGVTCSCGFVNKEGARFCAKCGTAL